MKKKQPGKKIKCSYLGVRKLLPEYGQVGEVQMGLAHEVILTNYVLIINLNIESHQRHLYCRIRRNCRKYFYLIFSIILPFLSPMSRLGIFSILRNGRLFWETLQLLEVPYRMTVDCRIQRYKNLFLLVKRWASSAAV